MKTGTLLSCVLLTALLAATSAIAQGDDIYLVSGGKLWIWPSRGAATNRPEPRAIGLHPTLQSIESIAINSRSIAFVTGLVYQDKKIYQTDGVTATVIYQHSSWVRQVAFGASDDVLYFSAVDEPAHIFQWPDGKIYQLNLATKVVTPYLFIKQSTLGGDWHGVFTIEGPRTYIATTRGEIYQVYPNPNAPSGPSQVALSYRTPGPNQYIFGLTAETGPLFYSSGGAELNRLRLMTDSTLAVSIPNGRITHVTYAPLPTTMPQPCELLIKLSGNANVMTLFTPVIHGPNLHWSSTDLSGNGGATGPANYRYFVARGTYWVSMDTKADTTAHSNPLERKVDCNGVQGEALFSF